MNDVNLLTLRTLLDAQESSVLAAWLRDLEQVEGLGGRISAADLDDQARQFLAGLKRGLTSGGTDPRGPEFASLREILTEISGNRALQGFSPGETASFVFSFKQPMLQAVRAASGADVAQFVDVAWDLNQLIDQLGIFTFEMFQKTREEVILRQQREIAELSTPVVKLWDRVLALPLIGTLDSERTQVVMENLLQSIVDEGADIAIIDITGVPTVDTLVAQHLLKTVAAARLMGADCIVSGIRPQIAQTMVHLGVELNVVSKASLADAFAVALARTGKVVVTQKAKP
jgi:rsbT co-antagonist protein RsbR